MLALVLAVLMSCSVVQPHKARPATFKERWFDGYKHPTPHKPLRIAK